MMVTFISKKKLLFRQRIKKKLEIKRVFKAITTRNWFKIKPNKTTKQTNRPARWFCGYRHLTQVLFWDAILVRATNAVIKHMNKSNLGKKGLI